MEMRTISIRGAAEHNLREVDVDLPHGALIAVSGVSGSGKTSLAFGTVYAEARRRYLMTLERGSQGLARRLHAPKVRRLDGLSPAVAIDQHRGWQNPRATVATLAGVYDYLRLLFARLGQARCLACGAEVMAQRFEEVYEHAAGLPEGTRLLVMAPRRLRASESGAELMEWVDRAGYRRLRLNGEQVVLDDLEPGHLQGRRIEVVVDRLVIKSDTVRRLHGSLQAALELGEGQIVLQALDGEEVAFAVRPTCGRCGEPFKDISPALFSFNSAQGACPSCRGLGVQTGLTFVRVFAGGRATLEDALGTLWQDFGHDDLREKLLRFCQRSKVEADVPLGEWSGEVAQQCWEGGGKRGAFIGVRRWLERLRAKAADAELAWLDERLEDTSCEVCQGVRLGPEALAVGIDGRSIGDLTALSIEEAAAFWAQLSFEGPRAPIGARLAGQISQSMDNLLELGLGYLTLNRRADSLSSGEFQRLRLGAVLGSGMTQVLYVLDEPSIGLHARDAERLLKSLKRLRDNGNTVLLVEHDAVFIAQSDYTVDLGPGAGVEGGQIVAAGPPAQVAQSDSLTGRYLRGELSVGQNRERAPGRAGWLELQGASGHNLHNLSVAFPLGNLVCVTGVSGSGKSTLVHETLYPLLAAQLQQAERRPLAYESCAGVEQLERVIAVDQKPIGRTPRSNAATYTGLLTHIRHLFAEVAESRLRGYRPSHFSFNTPEGACESCRGSGVDTVRQGVFEDLEIPCNGCDGRRYKREILDVRYRDLSIADVLELSAAAAAEIFAAIPEIGRRLHLLQEVGLGYLLLGQAAHSLSGGEAQRVKLAAELGRPQGAHTLYILDEPTTGLHLEDVRFLVELLQRLVDEDNSVIVVEHHIELIALADYVIDMGPEGGAGGGQVVAQGVPGEIAAVESSWTGQYLRRYFAGDR